MLQVQTVTGMLLRRLVEKTDVYHLTEEKIRLIVTASALHDIGKISIPENILNKPGRLTPEEFDVIRTHPAIGASMLEGLTPYRKEPLLKTAIEICRCSRPPSKSAAGITSAGTAAATRTACSASRSRSRRRSSRWRTYMTR